ncbi:hypothetical protein TNCV_1019401 [Trichonephila clavipes]|nr:hypothetical protein TNCV_1019401 [Trichonephila clavipes]
MVTEEGSKVRPVAVDSLLRLRHLRRIDLSSAHDLSKQQSHEQGDKLLSAYVIVRLVESSNPVQMTMLCANLPGDSTACFEFIP